MTQFDPPQLKVTKKNPTTLDRKGLQITILSRDHRQFACACVCAFIFGEVWTLKWHLEHHDREATRGKGHRRIPWTQLQNFRVPKCSETDVLNDILRYSILTQKEDATPSNKNNCTVALETYPANGPMANL